MGNATIAVVTAGISNPSSSRLLADRISAAVTKAFGDRETASTISVIELREYATDIAKAQLTGFASTKLQPIVDQVVAADAVVAVSPIFRASYNGLFKTFFDVLPEDALVNTPVLVAATGGTPRHSLALEYALRPLFAYLRALVTPTALFAATDDWGSLGARAGNHLEERIARAADELAALTIARPLPAPELDPPVVPFAAQLAALRPDAPPAD